MPPSFLKTHAQPHHRIGELESEIARLEKELDRAEAELNGFTARIRAELRPQIIRMQELTILYKKLKASKKAQRLNQKKKGKNYREPLALKRTPHQPAAPETPQPQNHQELKRLYKAAIRQVHPDKFATEEAAKNERATALTMQLNEFYESGDLEELKGLYAYIISGNAMTHEPYKPETISDPASLLVFLQKKQARLKQALEEIKVSELFNVLATYEQPLTFIPELKLQFEEKIRQLEKRTRKAGNL
ncbi:MAG TPA: hypothetical protein VK927_08045 [Adhaeribacter sp.]|nr:hypothetical protein [Adhaeribacter sp.]